MWTPGRADSTSYLGVVDAKGVPTPAKSRPKLAWILCDRTGRRFMDEYPPYPGDFGSRPLDLYNSKTQSFPRIPAFMIFDKSGRTMYPLGRSVINGREALYEWSADNKKEIELGFFERAETLEELAKIMKVDFAVLHQTLAHWNEACDAGNDNAFGRLPETMVPIKKPPFYVGQVWPMVINTQGGPVRNARQQVMNNFGEPIPRLFAAGELGSVFRRPSAAAISPNASSAAESQDGTRRSWRPGMLREADLVLIRHSDGVQHLTLNRPDKRNAMSRALIHALKAAFEACDADPAVRVVVLDGAGAGFCAGADLTETGAIATEDGASAHANLIASLLITPRTLSKPVIAQVHGFALGAGCGLALACNSIVCANDARLGYPEMARGVLPALVVPLLVRDVGRKAAFEF